MRHIFFSISQAHKHNGKLMMMSNHDYNGEDDKDDAHHDDGEEDGDDRDDNDDDAMLWMVLLVKSALQVNSQGSRSRRITLFNRLENTQW